VGHEVSGPPIAMGRPTLPYASRDGARSERRGPEGANDGEGWKSGRPEATPALDDAAEETVRRSEKAALRRIARLEKQLAAARHQEAKRRRQLHAAGDEVRDLTERLAQAARPAGPAAAEGAGPQVEPAEVTVREVVKVTGEPAGRPAKPATGPRSRAAAAGRASRATRTLPGAADGSRTRRRPDRGGSAGPAG
jgi:hypothetical protein